MQRVLHSENTEPNFLLLTGEKTKLGFKRKFGTLSKKIYRIIFLVKKIKLWQKQLWQVLLMAKVFIACVIMAKEYWQM